MRRAIQIGLLLTLAAMHMRAAEIANLRNGFGIRHESRENRGEQTRLYLSSSDPSNYVDVATAEIETYEPAPPEAEPAGAKPAAKANLTTIISSASGRSRIDADFIASVIRAESGGNPKAVSPKGAQGLMQLMPQTASTLGVKNRLDPAENVDGGVRYLRELLLQYNGDAARALAAYNAGPLRVQQYGGVPPYRETHAYVARVITDYNRKKTAEAKRTPQMPADSRNASERKHAITQSSGAGGK